MRTWAATWEAGDFDGAAVVVAKTKAAAEARLHESLRQKYERVGLKPTNLQVRAIEENASHVDLLLW